MENEKSEKKVYQTPELTKWGSIEDITNGGFGGTTDVPPINASST